MSIKYFYMKNFLLLLISIITFPSSAQKQITLEDIWAKGTFQTKSVPGFNFLKNGKEFTKSEKNIITKYDISNGDKTSTILDATTLKGKAGFSGSLDSYTFSFDENKILIEESSEGIYRRSSKANVYVYDSKNNELTRVFDFGKISNAIFSPDGNKVAFTFENNLYFRDLTKNKVTQITLDGKKNNIINGMCDWVYEEEFSFTRAFEWSEDGEKIAFIRFDESKVPEFIMPVYNDESYPTYDIFKYPKVGAKNAEVRLMIYDLTKGKNFDIDLGNMNEMYLPRIKWTKDENKVCVFKMNRFQNHLQLYLVDAKSRKATMMMEEKNKYYIDIHDNLTFTRDGKHFIWTSEKEGWNSIYLYNIRGQEIKQLTESKYDVNAMYGFDEKKSRVYFQASMDSPLEQNVYSIKLDGKDLKKLTNLKGVNSADFSPTFEYFTWKNSTANTPPTFTVCKENGDKVRILQENEELKKLQKEYNPGNIDFFQFNTSENVKLNAWSLKPKNFNSNKKYPVLITQYSGPGSQEVTDSWQGADYWWHQLLAQNGYIVVCVDPRGTGSRGEEFKKMTYLQLGKFETIDLIETAKYLGSLPYVDKARIGIFGWSYGGYTSSLAILKGSEYFKAAIAVAPVTNWKWYDSVYTERYMKTLAENESGYKENSPVYFADKLKGNYLLIHGTADDNVHFQNSAEMAKELIKHNKQFDTYYYTNRNHGIYGDNARIHLFTKMANFIYEKL